MSDDVHEVYAITYARVDRRSPENFLGGDPHEVVARRLLRTNLSDLAAKGAEPYGYFLAVAWPPASGWPERQAFAAGLKVDGEAFGAVLLGGDTVSTPGPLTVSLTMLGWTPAGRMVRRGGAKAGDLVMVSGPIGDGCGSTRRNTAASPSQTRSHGQNSKSPSNTASGWLIFTITMPSADMIGCTKNCPSNSSAYQRPRANGSRARQAK